MFLLTFLLLFSFFSTIFSYITFEYFFIPKRVFSGVSEFVQRREAKKGKLEQVAVTVCEVLRDLRKRNGCFKGTPDDGWNWLGSSTAEGEFVIYSGNFYTLSLKPRSSTFSCDESDRFGRYLFFRYLKLEDYFSTTSLLPASYYVKVPVSSTDPCGVGDFVWSFGLLY